MDQCKALGDGILHMLRERGCPRSAFVQVDELAPAHRDAVVAAGACIRPLFSSASAVSDTKYTPNPPKRLLNIPQATPECAPYPTESTYVEPKSGQVSAPAWRSGCGATDGASLRARAASCVPL